MCEGDVYNALALCGYLHTIRSGLFTREINRLTHGQSSQQAVRCKMTKSVLIRGSAAWVVLEKSQLCVLRAAYGVQFLLPECCIIARDVRKVYSRHLRHARPRYLHRTDVIWTGSGALSRPLSLSSILKSDVR